MLQFSNAGICDDRNISYIHSFSYNYLLTYDSYVPVYNRFHRGEWITRASGGKCPGPPPPTRPSNPFPPMKSIIHRAIRISGQ